MNSYSFKSNWTHKWYWILKLWCLLVNIFCLCDELTGNDPKLISRSIPLLGGVEIGYYYVNARIGKPFQNETLIVSTT